MIIGLLQYGFNFENKFSVSMQFFNRFFVNNDFRRYLFYRLKSVTIHESIVFKINVSKILPNPEKTLNSLYSQRKIRHKCT